MKKFLVLTSVLALAACGGGSGGDGRGHAGGAVSAQHAVPGGTGFVSPRAAVSSEIASSNSEITSMNSEVVVASNGQNHVVSSREPVSKTVGGVTYTSYRLDDVKLFMADNPDGDNGYLNLVLDDNTGEINAIKMVINNVESGEIARGSKTSGESDIFRGPIFEYVLDSFVKGEGNADFLVPNTQMGMLNAIANKRGFACVGGEWETDSETGKWVYSLGNGDYAEVNNQKFSVDATDDAVKDAVVDAYNFGDGKWVADGENFKYLKFGDQAAHRVVDNGTITMADLNAYGYTGGHWNRIDERMIIKTYGGDVQVNGQPVKLQYADFGYFNPVYYTKNTFINEDVLDAIRADKTPEQIAALRTSGDSVYGEDEQRSQSDFDAEIAKADYQLFAGGYAIKSNGTKVDTLNPTAGMQFKGTAIGRVYSSIQSNGVNRGDYLDKYNVTYNPSADIKDASHPYNAGHKIAKAFVTNNATLDINGNNQVLNMDFTNQNFYNVTVTKDSDDNVNFDFSLTSADGNTTIVPQQDANYGYMYYRDTDIQVVKENEAVKPDGTLNQSATAQTFNAGYYGVDTPTEAAGTVRYYEESTWNPGADVTREWEFQAAYGMTN